MKTREIAVQGIWLQNPALVQLLGLCPLLAVSNTITNSLILGLTTLVVLTCSNFIISLIRNWLDESTRLPAQIIVIATFVTISDLLLQTWFFEIHQRIGLFVALIVTNCTILGRTESFASRQPVYFALIDGFMMGLGFLLVIVCMGFIREAVGQGTLFSQLHLILGGSQQDWLVRLPNDRFLLMIMPPGAFLLLGCIIASKNWIQGDLINRQDHEQRKKNRDTQTS